LTFEYESEFLMSDSKAKQNGKREQKPQSKQNACKNRDGVEMEGGVSKMEWLCHLRLDVGVCVSVRVEGV